MSGEWLKTTTPVRIGHRVIHLQGSNMASTDARWRRWTARLACPLLLLLLTIGFYWKLTLTRQFTWLNNPDLAFQVLPWWQFQAGEWHAGHFPLWDPHHWGGQSLIGQAQPGAAYPLNWLLFRLPLSNGWLRESYLNWYFVLVHFQAAFGAWWLARVLGRSRPASILAGVGFAFGAYMGATDWPQMLNGAVWAPYLMACLWHTRESQHDRRDLWRTLSWSAGAGAILGISLLSGHHQIPVFLGLAAGAFWLWTFTTREISWRDTLVAAAVFGVIALLVSGLQTLPALEYGMQAVRWVSAERPVGWKDPVPYYVHQTYSIGPASLLSIVLPIPPRAIGAYVGFAVFGMAWIGVVAAWRDRAVPALVVLGGLGWVLALGGFSPIHGILYALVPMVEKARTPASAILLFQLSISVLSAYGIDYFEAARDTTRRLVRYLSLAAAAVWLIVLWMTLHQTAVDERISLAALAGVGVALVAAAWRSARIRPAVATALLVILALHELANTSTWRLQRTDDTKSDLHKLSQHSDIAGFLQDRREPVRVLVDSVAVPYNFGDWYGIDQYNGYLASLTATLSDTQGLPLTSRLFGTNYYIGLEPREEGQNLVFQSVSGVKVYREEGAMPRAWIVHRARGGIRRDQVAGELSSSTFTPRQETFVEGQAPRLEDCGTAGSATFVERSASRIVLDANLSCRGMLISGETYDPGWHAKVDGTEVPVLSPYLLLRGVVLGAGNHRVEFYYRPQSVIWGGLMTLVGLILTGLLAATAAFRHRKDIPAAR